MNKNGMKTQKKFTITALSWMLLASTTLGFRVYPGGNMWKNSSQDPKIWIRFCDNYVPSKNDLNDSLAGTTLTHTTILNSILSDYHSVAPSWLVLADAGTDAAFNSTTHSERVINICQGSTQTLIAGFAQPKYSDDSSYQNGCEIQFTGKILESAKEFVSTITHEIGHCIGLDHPQDTRYAVMSYFSDTDRYFRLQTDDKMALSTLFPKNPSQTREEASFGLACQPRS